jgi:hypothetical protein
MTDGYGVECVCPQRFDIGTNSSLSTDGLSVEKASFLNSLAAHGYAVVANVATKEDIKFAHDRFWSFCTESRPSIDRNDLKTWSNVNWLPSSSSGILGTMDFNHDQFCWKSRVLPSVAVAFSEIWGCPSRELIVSYDGGNAFRPWKRNLDWLTHGGWWHVDQNSLIGPSRQGCVCVQGLVLYTDANADTGGLCVVPGSHLQHEEVCSRGTNSQILMDFVEVDPNDEVLSMPKHLISAKAGDLIVWDSRTVHCNTPATTASRGPEAQEAASNNPDKDPATPQEPVPSAVPELLRLAAYVCMLPRDHASAAVIAQRKQAFVHRIPSSHWPNKPLRVAPAKNPRLPPQDPAAAPDEVLRLVGYTDQEIMQLRNS